MLNQFHTIVLNAKYLLFLKTNQHMIWSVKIFTTGSAVWPMQNHGHYSNMFFEFAYLTWEAIYANGDETAVINIQ